ncbi:MAG: PBSX family phage terminase large subunit [Bacteroidales bacterium]|nr:PBSX family phage terminase large subunit [Bacteroidales bacterium]
MKLLEFNQKVKDSIEQTGFLNVWEGAVRSSKTSASLLAWASYIIMSPERVFLMSGATMGSISRNCIVGDFGFVSLTGAKQKTDTDGSKYIQLFDNLIYYVGGDNIRSFQKIRGMTIGGWYADEINLHHQDFIVEAFNRSLASTDRKNFWTLNPDVPSHPIYERYLDKFLADNLPGYHYHHFTLDDNPAITAERKEELERQYTGVFYQRYILGRRVRAEGAIYTSFDRDRHIIRENPKDVLFAIIGADIGGNKSATSYVVTGFFWKDGKLAIAALDELYDKENVSTEHILKNFKVFAEKQKALYTIQDGYVDSAEQLILKSMRNIGVLNVHGSKKIKIVDRIRLLDYLFACDRAFIHKRCKHLIDAIENAVWDPKGMKEERLDDGTSNVDSLDSFEYSFEGKYRELMV